MAKQQKQGGNGKSSSPSAISYWLRVRPEAQRRKRITRHARRLMKQEPSYMMWPNPDARVYNLIDSQIPPVFPKIPKSRGKSKVYDSGIIPESNLKKMAAYPIYQLIHNGVLLNSGFSRPGTTRGGVIIRQHPLGRREIIS